MFCLCDRMPGCMNENGHFNHCLVCQFYLNYSFGQLEKVKRNVPNLILLYIEIKNQQRDIEIFDEYSHELSDDCVCYRNKFTGQNFSLENSIVNFYFR